MFGVWWFLDRRKSLNKSSNLYSKIFSYKIILFIFAFLMKSSCASPENFGSLGQIEDDNLFMDDNEAFSDTATKYAKTLQESLKPIDEDTYIKYLLRAASFNQQLYSKKLQRHLNFQPQLSNSAIRKVFKLDKNLQRLEKKSWKIPIKSIALYTENSQDSKIIGDLKKLFHSFKDS